MFQILPLKMKFVLLYQLYILIGNGKTADCSNEHAPKIVGGHEAFPGQFPWMVSFQLLNERDQVWEHTCGGAIIDHRHIISAAHCYKYSKSKFRVVAGAHNISQPDSAEPSRQAYNTCQIDPHPDWNLQFFTNDMMVVTLKKPILFNERVQPVRLAPADSNSVGKVCVVCGWGFMGPGLKEQNLQTINMTVISLDECMPWAERGPFQINKFNVCARSVHDGAPRWVTKDYFKKTSSYKLNSRPNYYVTVCMTQGDSGSPLVCYDEKGPYVTGTVSWGSTDDERGIVFGGVKEHLDFIKCRGKKG